MIFYVLGILKHKQRIPSTVMVNCMFYPKLPSEDNQESIKNILLEANNRISPTGLNDFFILIKNKLSDSNKNYIKMLISLLSEFISALKKDFKPWSKMIAQSLIPNLSDKNQSIRNECQKCFEIWIDNIGFDSLVIYFPQFLKNLDILVYLF